jgi:hypothetical protein
MGDRLAAVFNGLPDRGQWYGKPNPWVHIPCAICFTQPVTHGNIYPHFSTPNRNTDPGIAYSRIYGYAYRYAATRYSHLHPQTARILFSGAAALSDLVF